MFQAHDLIMQYQPFALQALLGEFIKGIAVNAVIKGLVLTAQIFQALD